MGEQAPDLNNLQPHPDKEMINLARAAEAAYELEHPSTPGQIEAARGDHAVDLVAIRERFAAQNTAEADDNTESNR